MQLIPLDTRERILTRYDSGTLTRAEVADLYFVSVDFVKKLLKQRKKLGHVKPLYERVGRKPAIQGDEKVKLNETLRENPGATLAELCVSIDEICTTTSVWRALRRMGFTHKKKRCAPLSKTAKTSKKPARRGGF
jgi:transposase